MECNIPVEKVWDDISQITEKYIESDQANLNAFEKKLAKSKFNKHKPQMKEFVDKNNFTLDVCSTGDKNTVLDAFCKSKSGEIEKELQEIVKGLADLEKKYKSALDDLEKTYVKCVKKYEECDFTIKTIQQLDVLAVLKDSLNSRANVFIQNYNKCSGYFKQDTKSLFCKSTNTLNEIIDKINTLKQYNTWFDNITYNLLKIAYEIPEMPASTTTPVEKFNSPFEC